MTATPEYPTEEATRERSRVALVTCAELPDLDPDDRLVVPALAALGVRARPAVWDDPDVDWSRYDLAVLRSTWDYPGRRDEFVAWAGRVPSLANPADVVAWNTDKRYLADLARAGAPVVPTTWAPPADLSAAAGVVVIKPAVGAGSKDTGRYDLADPDHRRLAEAHLDRLRAAGRVAMIQPYLSAVDDAGETALLFLRDPTTGDLAYSHAVRKGPMLTGPDHGTAGLYLPEEISPRTPAAAELSAARTVLGALPFGTRRLLYARVDLIPGPDGDPLLVELELAEPSLFLGHAEGAAARFAAAVTATLT